MAHTSNCAGARGDKCVCDCMTALHGTAHLHRAGTFVRTPNPHDDPAIAEKNRKVDAIRVAENTKVKRLREAIDKGLDGFRKARRAPRKKGTHRPISLNTAVRRKFHDIAVSSIVVYLGDHPDELDEVNRVAQALGKSVVVALSEALGGDEEFKTRKGKSGSLGLSHLWCSILAALAEGMDEFKNLTVEFRDYVIEAVIRAPVKSADKRIDWFTVMRRHFVKLLVTSVWATLQNAFELSSGWRAFLKAVRILAIIVCPNVDRHPEVMNHCVLPLMQELMAEEAFAWFQTNLHEAYPKVFAAPGAE